MLPLLQIDAPAPDFTLPDLKGRLHALADYRGRLAIVNFWSAECPWTARADKSLRAWLSAWGDRVAYLPVASNANETPGQLANVARERSIAMVLVDAGAGTADRYGAFTTPHLFVVDPAGILRYQGAFNNFTFGLRTPTQYFLKEAVDALLAGRLPEIRETQPSGGAIVRHAT